MSGSAQSWAAALVQMCASLLVAAGPAAAAVMPHPGWCCPAPHAGACPASDTRLLACRRDEATKDEPADAAGAGAVDAATIAGLAVPAAASADPAADAAAAVAAALRGLPQQVPVQYDRLGRELQKWIQCSKCEKWRKVPYGLDDGEIPEEWQVRLASGLVGGRVGGHAYPFLWCAPVLPVCYLPHAWPCARLPWLHCSAVASCDPLPAVSAGLPARLAPLVCLALGPGH